MLEIPPWWWDMVDLGAAIEAKGVARSEVTANAWELARACFAAWQSVRAAREESEKKRKAQLKAIFG